MPLMFLKSVSHNILLKAPTKEEKVIKAKKSTAMDKILESLDLLKIHPKTKH